MLSILLLLFDSVPKNKARTLHVIGMHHTTELHFQITNIIYEQMYSNEAVKK